MDLEWFRVHHYAKMEDLTVRICENRCISIFLESQKNTYWNKCSWSEIPSPRTLMDLDGVESSGWNGDDSSWIHGCWLGVWGEQGTYKSHLPICHHKWDSRTLAWRRIASSAQKTWRCQHLGFLGCKLFPTLIRSQGVSPNPSVPMVWRSDGFLRESLQGVSRTPATGRMDGLTTKLVFSIVINTSLEVKKKTPTSEKKLFCSWSRKDRRLFNMKKVAPSKLRKRRTEAKRSQAKHCKINVLCICANREAWKRPNTANSLGLAPRLARTYALCSENLQPAAKTNVFEQKNMNIFLLDFVCRAGPEPCAWPSGLLRARCQKTTKKQHQHLQLNARNSNNRTNEDDNNDINNNENNKLLEQPLTSPSN